FQTSECRRTAIIPVLIGEAKLLLEFLACFLYYLALKSVTIFRSLPPFGLTEPIPRLHNRKEQ
ncbi:MAG: hypothetical protein ACRC6P_11240, partial [Shewanella oncorhynchi]